VLGRPGQPLLGVVGACVWALTAACSDREHAPAPHRQVERAQIPNPAARKCLEDGYALEPVRDADGVPVDHHCVDATTGKRCEVWEYFRGECRLRIAPAR